MNHIEQEIQKLREAGYKENKLKKIKRNMLKGELKETYYTKVGSTSKSGNKYSKLQKRLKKEWIDRSIVSFKEVGNNLVVWPVAVKDAS